MAKLLLWILLVGVVISFVESFVYAGINDRMGIWAWGILSACAIVGVMKGIDELEGRNVNNVRNSNVKQEQSDFVNIYSKKG